jgi:CarD family transcriptional regulator
MFKVGDLAVYPAQGVGVIEAIEKKEIMGNNQTFIS